MFGMFSFGAGYFGDGPGVTVVIVGPVDLVHLQASIRRHVALTVAFHRTVGLSASLGIDVTTDATVRQDVRVDAAFRTLASMTVER
jgi:hypothetical protein